MRAEPEGACELQLKRAADSRGLIVHAYNLGEAAVEQRLGFPAASLDSACVCDPVEVDGAPLPVADGGFTLSVPPRSVRLRAGGVRRLCLARWANPGALLNALRPGGRLTERPYEFRRGSGARHFGMQAIWPWAVAR